MARVTVTKDRYTVDKLYQWDKNQVLEIRGLSLPSVPEIHFTNDTMDRAIVRQATMDEAGVIRVDVPNSLLQTPYSITVFVCVYEDDDTFKTLYKILVPVDARPKPNDYVIEDSDGEIYSFNALENKIENALVTMTAKCDGIISSAANEAKKVAAAESKKAAKTEVDQIVDEMVSSVNAAKNEVINAKTAAVEAKNSADNAVAVMNQFTGNITDLWDTVQELWSKMNELKGVDLGTAPFKHDILSFDYFVAYSKNAGAYPWHFQIMRRDFEAGTVKAIWLGEIAGKIEVGEYQTNATLEFTRTDDGYTLVAKAQLSTGQTGDLSFSKIIGYKYPVLGQ